MRINLTITRVALVLALLALATLEIGARSLSHNPRFVAYIQRHYAEAQRQMQRHNIPASIKMAQGLLETGAGQSSLAVDHNNHFGIKCHNTWQGKRTYKTDDLPDECFRSYRSWQESYEDHSLFLLRPRYQRLFALRRDDYRGWARGLQQAGYATNKAYANSLIKIIEDYELYALDQGRLPSYMGGKRVRSSQRVAKRGRSAQASPTLTRSVYSSYGLLYVLAKAGDTYERLESEVGISARKLARYNEMPEDYPLQAGDIVYLERKNGRADREHKLHRVRVGESMHSISQRYGIRLSKLYRLNDKDEDYLPEEGDILRLR